MHRKGRTILLNASPFLLATGRLRQRAGSHQLPGFSKHWEERTTEFERFMCSDHAGQWHCSWWLVASRPPRNKEVYTSLFLSISLSPGWLSSQYMISIDIIDIMNIVHWPFTCKCLSLGRHHWLGRCWCDLGHLAMAFLENQQAVPEMARANSDTYRMLNRKHFRNFAGKVKDNSWKGERQISQM